MTRHGRPWTREEDELLADMFEQGLADFEMAARLKRSSSSVEARRGIKRLLRVNNAPPGTRKSTPPQEPTTTCSRIEMKRSEWQDVGKGVRARTIEAV